MKRSLLFSAVVTGSLLCGMLSLASAQDEWEKTMPQLRENSIAQINLLAKEKAGRTEAQKKISSQLLYAIKKKAGDSIFNKLPEFKTTLSTEENGMVLVDIKATVTPELLALIEELGGEVVNSFAEYDAIRARMPVEDIETLAERPDIVSIREAVKAHLNKQNTSEGDKAHNGSIARNHYKVDGTGVKVGVISDSVDHLASVQATGDLPHITVLEDAPNNTGEGTAMLEIVHDLAPGAQLYFATAWNGAASFATNIKRLEQAGCDVIVDDVGYFNESPFQDDIISQAVNYVSSKGVLYFSAAGNDGNFNDHTAQVWEGNYHASSAVPSSMPGLYTTVNNFGGGDVTNGLTENTSFIVLNLFWADPLGHSNNDYDLFLLTSSGDVLAASADIQDGNDDPYEALGGSSSALNGAQVVVAKYSGANRFIHLDSSVPFQHVTSGKTRGHATAVNGFGVAAVDAMLRTIPFTTSNAVERFSSDGPRRVFFYPNGNAITPGNYSATGGVLRQKPDIAAADGVQTATPGFNPFYGTSAAAPHAAAIGALLRSGKPDITIAEVRDIFNSTAIDIEGAGYDRDSGAGIIMADAVLKAAGIHNVVIPPLIYLLQ